MMKTIEQKAARYDEALERAKNLHRDAIDMGENILAKQCEIIFHELKESEDECVEKIKKDIMSYLNNRQITSIAESSATEKWLAWLEKQGEKSADEMIEALRTEYEKGRADAITEMQGGQKPLVIDEGKAEMDYCFTKMMNGEKVSSAWSEEDNKAFDSILNDLRQGVIPDNDDIDWLKSLKERYIWKPSEAQMDNLRRAFNGATYQVSRLRELYYDLKKLKEE